MTNEYLATTGPLPVISEKALSKYSMQTTKIPTWNVGITNWDIAGNSPGNKFEIDDQVYTAVGMPSTTMVTNGRRTAFHTDVFMHSSPILELTRYFNADNPRPSEFGYGWSLLIPYKLEPTDDKKIIYQGVSLPEKMTVVDLITNRKEVLKFEGKKYINVGYFSEEESSHFKGLLLMADASYVLVDRWDNSFHFDKDRKIIVVDMGPQNKWSYVYKGDRIVGMVNEVGGEIKFMYDQNGRITKADIANKGNVKGEVTYIYDAKGDLVKVIGLDRKGLDYQYNSNHVLLSLIPSDSGWKMWQYAVVIIISLSIGIGIFIINKELKRKTVGGP